MHTVYGGAHLFTADIVAKFRDASLRSLQEYAPTARLFAAATGLQGDSSFQEKIYRRVLAKLEREPVEDYRIDFEDGFGDRSEKEEDHHATRCAVEMAGAQTTNLLPPFIGIRIKPITGQSSRRALKTLNLFVSTLLGHSGGKLPPGFVVTLPKISSRGQAARLTKSLRLMESRLHLSPGSLKFEIMVESPRLFDGNRSLLSEIVRESRGRCVGAHFGPFDYTASLGVAASHQRLDHPACDVARVLMQVALAGSGVFLSDGPTNLLPVGPHRMEKGKPLTAGQKRENRRVVQNAWRLSFQNIRRALDGGFYQGWDLHPAQLPVRYAAVFSFFLEEMTAASDRLNNFLAKNARPTMSLDIFDDAASGRGLFNFFQRGIWCGAFSKEDLQNVNVDEAQLTSGTFENVVVASRGRTRNRA